MAQLRIPKDDLSAFVAIAGLDENSFQALLKGMTETEPSLNSRKYLDVLIAKHHGFKRETTQNIVTALLSLYDLKDKRGIPAAELAAAISEAAKEIPKSVADFSDEKIPILKQRLTSLLSLDRSLGIMQKAAALSKEHERIFCGSRIFSEVRPVFVSTTATVAAAIVVHNLQIAFHDGASGEHKEIYVALDDDDLVKMKEMIERAQKKNTAIQTMLKNSKTSLVGVY